MPANSFPHHVLLAAPSPQLAAPSPQLAAPSPQPPGGGLQPLEPKLVGSPHFHSTLTLQTALPLTRCFLYHIKRQMSNCVDSLHHSKSPSRQTFQAREVRWWSSFPNWLHETLVIDTRTQLVYFLPKFLVISSFAIKAHATKKQRDGCERMHEIRLWHDWRESGTGKVGRCTGASSWEAARQQGRWALELSSY